MIMKFWKSKKFWEDAIERAVLTGVQVPLGALTGETLNMFETDWSLTLKLAASAAVVSLLKSIVAGHFGNPESASLVQ